MGHFIADSIYTERYMMEPSENSHAYLVSFTPVEKLLAVCIGKTNFGDSKHKLCAELHSDREGQEFPFGQVSLSTRNSRW